MYDGYKRITTRNNGDLNIMLVLTSEVNDYNQCGEYFVCLFSSRPSFNELKSAIESSQFYVDESIIDQICGNLIRAGGGRLESEDCWFFLREENPIN